MILPLHGDAPQYLQQFTPIADVPSRQSLRSSSSDDLLVPAVRLPSVGRRAFVVAARRRSHMERPTYGRCHLSAISQKKTNCICFDFHILA